MGKGLSKLGDHARAAPCDRAWTARAVALLAKERCRTANAPLLNLAIPELPGVDIYLKDEASHPSGSLKHRLAHALYLHAICNGQIGPDTLVVEASSGSTAISEAWFARVLGLRFVAVVPGETVHPKIEAIEALGARVVRAAPGSDICAQARALASAEGGHFMDQFGRASEVTDWRGSNNIAEDLFGQLAREPHRVPSWLVMGAGTGGTSATIGRYIRFRPELASARLCVVDPEGSAFFKAYAGGGPEAAGRTSQVVEGIGRPRVEPSFMPGVIDRMIAVPDAASVAGIHWLMGRTGRRFGPSTGTNVIGALRLACEMVRRGEEGSVVTFGCDAGERYLATAYDPVWLRRNGIDLGPWVKRLAQLGRAELF